MSDSTNSSTQSVVEADGEGASASSPAPLGKTIKLLVPKPEYVEHRAEQVHGFQVVDATNRDPIRAHDDLIWVGFGGMDGRWLKPYQVMELSDVLRSVLNSHLARHGVDFSRGVPA